VYYLSEPKLVAKELVKIYRDGTVAVSGISFEADKGINILMGPNGSGKTTTLSMIAGALKPTKGLIHVCGYNLWGSGWFKGRECIGFAPQKMPFMDRLTAVENLVWIGLMKGLSLGEANRSALQLLEEVGLTDAKNKLVTKLSGGMKRKLTIAASLLGDPEIVILDEPTSGLDPSARETLWKIMENISGNKALIISTHIPEEAEEHADKVLVFHKGKLVASGAPYDLIKTHAPESLIEVQGIFPDKLPLKGYNIRLSSESKIIIATTDPDQDLPKLITELTRIGSKISTAKVRKPGLREVYLVLTGEALEET
jgi:ABC-2 type transport system ATP-binding protein